MSGAVGPEPTAPTEQEWVDALGTEGDALLDSIAPLIRRTYAAGRAAERARTAEEATQVIKSHGPRLIAPEVWSCVQHDWYGPDFRVHLCDLVAAAVARSHTTEAQQEGESL